MGEIDLDNWTDVAERLAAEVRTGAIRLDLSRITFFGAAGIRAVLHGRAALPPSGSLHLTCAPMVFRVLVICGLNEADGLVVTRAVPGRQALHRAGS